MKPLNQLHQEAESTTSTSGAASPPPTSQETPAATEQQTQDTGIDSRSNSADDAEGSGVDWNELLGEETGEEGEPRETQQQPQKPAEEQQTAVAKTGEETQQGQQQQQAGEQQTQQQQTPETQTVQTQETPAVETKTAEQLEKEAKDRQQAEYDQLVKYYALPEDLATKVQTEPETVLPVLAAKMHQSVLSSVERMLRVDLPQVVKQTQTVMVAEQAAKDQFYGAWPGLKDFETQVLEVGAMYRKMNPKADAKTATEKIGSVVCAALGLDPTQVRQNAAAAATQQQQQPVQQQVRRPGQQTFTPAGVAASARATQPAQSNNEFAQLAEEMLLDDQQ